MEDKTRWPSTSLYWFPGAEGDAAHAEVFAPFDRTLIATVACAGESGIEQALKTAYGLFCDRDRWLGPARRIEVLQAAAAIMQGRREQLAIEAAREGGKPLVDSLVEVDRAIDGVRLCVECLRTQAGREIPMGLNAASAGRLAFTRHEPIGVVVAFSAFNHPLNLIVHQVGPAVAAGCPVIVKPAKAAPAFLLAVRAASSARPGLPEEWCQALLTGDERLNRRLAGDRPGGLLQFHRQRPGGLDAAVAVGPRHALLAGARRRGPGDRGRRRRFRPPWCRCWSRAASIMPARSASPCSGSSPRGKSPRSWPTPWPSRPGP